MISRDYTREIDMPAGERPVSRPVTIIVLMLVALAGAAMVWQLARPMPGTRSEPVPVKVTSR